MGQINSCLICDSEYISEIKKNFDTDVYTYMCDICGHLLLTDLAIEKIYRLKPEDKIKLGIELRNEFENRTRKKYRKPFNAEQIEFLVNRSGTLKPLTKIDRALINLSKKTEFVGQEINIDYHKDYFFYLCGKPSEVRPLLRVLFDEDYIDAEDRINPQNKLILKAKGYKRLSEIEKIGSTNNCFVAMWFDPEMDKIYDQAIKPAIEFIEDGEKKPKYRAILIKNEDHLNNINDEIIAQIRRSRFMVCDLTGYRGGVYFEAGFAYGLGLDVIYTCRKDWSKEEILKDAQGKKGKKVEELYDKDDNPIRIKKEGVHFDLAPMNRIEWTMDDLDGFRDKLQNRIKANIV